jgi:hypothetical protein
MASLTGFAMSSDSQSATEQIAEITVFLALVGFPCVESTQRVSASQVECCSCGSSKEIVRAAHVRTFGSHFTSLCCRSLLLLCSPLSSSVSSVDLRQRVAVATQ